MHSQKQIDVALFSLENQYFFYEKLVYPPRFTRKLTLRRYFGLKRLNSKKFKNQYLHH